MLLAASFDESADGRRERFLSIGGFAAHQWEWLKYDRMWRPIHTALVERGAVFHAADCESQRGVFDGWNKDECDDLFVRLVDAVTSAELHGFCASVDMKALTAVFPKWKHERAAYFLCFQSCLLGIADWANNGRHVVAFTFDQKGEYEYGAHRLYGELKSNPAWNGSKALGNLDFSARHEWLPLHAADLLAREGFKFLENQTLRPDKPVRIPLERIERTGRLYGEFFGLGKLQKLRKLLVQDRDENWDRFKQQLLENPRYNNEIKAQLRVPSESEER